MSQTRPYNYPCSQARAFSLTASKEGQSSAASGHSETPSMWLTSSRNCWEKLCPEGNALESGNRARKHFSLMHSKHMWRKKLTLQGNEPVRVLSGMSCSLDAFSGLKLSDLLFALDRPHTATEPTATRMLRSTREESAQTETRSLRLVPTTALGSAAQQLQPTAGEQQLPLGSRERGRRVSARSHGTVFPRT